MTIRPKVGSCITRAQQHSMGWQGNSSEEGSIPFVFSIQDHISGSGPRSLPLGSVFDFGILIAFILNQFHLFVIGGDSDVNPNFY